MAANLIAESASEALLARKDEFARAVTQALYAEMPVLLAKYGEAGRKKCLQDMHYNLEHLAPAVALGEPAVFAGYVAWLRDMLEARGISPGEVRRSLQLTRAVVAQRLAAEQAELVAAAIDGGLTALEDSGKNR